MQRLRVLDAPHMPPLDTPDVLHSDSVKHRNIKCIIPLATHELCKQLINELDGYLLHRPVSCSVSVYLAPGQKDHASLTFPICLIPLKKVRWNPRLECGVQFILHPTAKQHMTCQMSWGYNKIWPPLRMYPWTWFLPPLLQQLLPM